MSSLASWEHTPEQVAAFHHERSVSPAALRSFHNLFTKRWRWSVQVLRPVRVWGLCQRACRRLAPRRCQYRWLHYQDPWWSTPCGVVSLSKRFVLDICRKAPLGSVLIWFLLLLPLQTSRYDAFRVFASIPSFGAPTASPRFLESMLRHDCIEEAERFVDGISKSVVNRTQLACRFVTRRISPASF